MTFSEHFIEHLKYLINCNLKGVKQIFDPSYISIKMYSNITRLIVEKLYEISEKKLQGGAS